MTIGPDPKPIRTGATLHTVCITNGPLSTYKLFARVYGGKSDQDINKHNKNTVTKLRMVSLYDFMLELFKHKGHCIVMDSAYMGDAMCQVGREEWGMNMVGTSQTDRTGAGALGKLAVNRIPVMAPILAPILGIHFFRGHISLKNGTFCPLFSHDSTSFKNMWLLT
jgi:hypothetical protein